MPVATTIDDDTLKAYLHAELGPVADGLSWTVVNGDYDEALDDALNLFGTGDIDNISGAANVDKIRILGLLTTWRRVARHTGADYDFSVDGGSFKRSQGNAQALTQIKDLERRAVQWLYPIKVQTFAPIHDPYGYRADKDRPL